MPTTNSISVAEGGCGQCGLYPQKSCSQSRLSIKPNQLPYQKCLHPEIPHTLRNLLRPVTRTLALKARRNIVIDLALDRVVL